MRALSSILIAPLLAASVLGCNRPSSPGAAQSAAPPTPLATPAQRKVLAALPVPYRNADLYNGQARFAVCRSCHTTAAGAGAAGGPNLWGVFGRRSGTAPGFVYSAGLKTLGVVWTADTLNAWIANPRGVVPGTGMAFAGLEDPGDRIDVIAYLKVVTTPEATATASPLSRGVRRDQR